MSLWTAEDCPNRLTARVLRLQFQMEVLPRRVLNLQPRVSKLSFNQEAILLVASEQS